MLNGDYIKIGNELYNESDVYLSASATRRKMENLKLTELAKYLKEQLPLEYAEILNAMKRIYPLRGCATTMRREGRKMIVIGNSIKMKVGNVDLYTGDIVKITAGEYEGEVGFIAQLFKYDSNPYHPVFDKIGIMTNDKEIALDDVTELVIIRHFNTLKQGEVVLNNDAEGFSIGWYKDIKEHESTN